MSSGGESGDAHRPVMLAEVLEGLQVRSDGFYVDGTFGRGGHSAAILERLGPQGRLWMVDKDPEAEAEARKRFGDDARCRFHRGSFSALKYWLEEEGLVGTVDGVLLDLGVSSPQLDRAERGFSFLRDGPLDMRMDPEHGVSAREWLSAVDEQELVRVLKVYGEERFARRIASRIVAARDADELPRTTGELANLVDAAVPRKERHKHPATRTFQALRIAVNGELDALERFLDDACDCLAPGGRLVAISFHSLEDRMVKQFMRRSAGVRDLPPEVPIIPEGLRPRMRTIGKAVKAGEEEVAANTRSRSAVLRIAERLQ